MLSAVSTDIEVFDSGNSSLGIFPVMTSTSGETFFGVISDNALIGRINILAGGSNVEVTDNIAFGAASAPVPEPTTWLTVGTGLLVMAWRLRPRRWQA
jgi:hypothetical protein